MKFRTRSLNDNWRNISFNKKLNMSSFFCNQGVYRSHVLYQVATQEVLNELKFALKVRKYFYLLHNDKSFDNDITANSYHVLCRKRFLSIKESTKTRYRNIM